MAFSPDGTLLATASNDGTARIWDLTAGTDPHHPGRPHRLGAGVAFSPDGTLLATASDDGTARIWDLAAAPAPAPPWKATPARCSGVAFSPDGTLLATAADDGTARIWDLAAGTARTTLEGHTGVVRAWRSPPTAPCWPPPPTTEPPGSGT